MFRPQFPVKSGQHDVLILTSHVSNSHRTQAGRNLVFLQMQIVILWGPVSSAGMVKDEVWCGAVHLWPSDADAGW
jgi:hypothetical protein